MAYVFLLEDSSHMAQRLIAAIEKQTDHKVVWANSKLEAEQILEGYTLEYLAAIVDLTLPDAEGVQVLDLPLVKELPTIVYTSNIQEDLRAAIWDKGIVDYVLKENPRSIDYLCNLVQRMEKNPGVKALIVDDSSVMRTEFKGRLETHRFEVLLVESAELALEVLGEHPDIKLMLVDYNMPGMNGIELTARVRESYGKDELSIIALSGQADEETSIQFLKAGANEYIDKSMSLEGFYSRISHQVEMIENLELLRDAGYKDFLTGLYNRRYFFETAHGLFAHVNRHGGNLTLAMLDIDHFKNLNDTFGHDAGDQALKKLAAIMQERFRASDIVARFGGEEFCILLTDTQPEEMPGVFETLRSEIEDMTILTEEGEMRITVSIGVCTHLRDSLKEMIAEADKLLYEAKDAGRNRVEIDMQSF